MLFARIFLLCLIAAALLPAQSVDLLPDESLKGWTRIPIPPTDSFQPKLQWRVDLAEKTLIEYRKAGCGPKHAEIARRILYSRKALAEWLDAGGTRGRDE